MGEDKQRVAEKNLGLFANAGGASPSGFLVPSNALTVGPGEPGPGDEWEFQRTRSTEPPARTCRPPSWPNRR